MIGLLLFIPTIPATIHKTQSKNCSNTRSAVERVTQQRSKQPFKQKPDNMKRLTGLAEAKAAKQATARRAKVV